MRKLSGRLSALTEMVPEGSAVLDVGCDHAFVPIALVQSGKSPFAVASDIRTGPLESAKRHILEADLGEKIAAVLADGVPENTPQIFDSLGRTPATPLTLVTAGMGGLMMLDILKKRPVPRDYFAWYLCSPQRDVPELRKGLAAEGFRIISEKMVEEDGKFYPLILSEYSEGELPPLPEEEALLGPVLMEENSREFQRYKAKLIRQTELILKSLPDHPTEPKTKLQEVLELLTRNRPNSTL